MSSLPDSVYYLEAVIIVNILSDIVSVFGCFHEDLFYVSGPGARVSARPRYLLTGELF